MSDAYKRRLLGTTLPVAMPHPFGLCNATALTERASTGQKTLKNCRKLMATPQPRWAGGDILGIRIEIATDMPDGWFGLREPGDPLPYAGLLPLTSFSVFYRGGDVVRLSPRNASQIAARSDPPEADEGARDGLR